MCKCDSADLIAQDNYIHVHQMHVYKIYTQWLARQEEKARDTRFLARDTRFLARDTRFLARCGT